MDHFPGVKALDLSQNKLKTIPDFPYHNESLHLDIRNNEISAINYFKCPPLQSL